METKTGKKEFYEKRETTPLSQPWYVTAVTAWTNIFQLLHVSFLSHLFYRIKSLNLSSQAQILSLLLMNADSYFGSMQVETRVPHNTGVQFEMLLWFCHHLQGPQWERFLPEICHHVQMKEMNAAIFHLK
jgi:hypothetical protein